MLDLKIIRTIEEFVYTKPRSIQEIAQLIGKNWRTADRYIEEIQKNFGTISTRVFREGTRGALKIIYWSSLDKVSSSLFQEKIEKDIFQSKKKEDFSAFDIYQYVPKKNRKSFIFTNEEENMEDLKNILLSAKKQILLFSGNLSFINLIDKKKDMLSTFEELIKRNISIKVLCRVDLAGIENIEKLLSLNEKYGKDLIQIHHDLHPLRGFVVDNTTIRLKEVKEPTGKIKELNNKKFIFYTIQDKSWSEWLSKIFWNKFANSINAQTRIEHLKHITMGNMH